MLAGSEISASKAGMLSCAREGSHLLVASSAEILRILCSAEHHSIDSRTSCPKTRPSPGRHGVL